MPPSDLYILNKTQLVALFGKAVESFKGEACLAEGGHSGHSLSAIGWPCFQFRLSYYLTSYAYGKAQATGAVAPSCS